MNPEQARSRLRAALSDEVMWQERLRVVGAVTHRATDLLAALGLSDALSQPTLADRLTRYREMHHIPGDHLWQAMQFVFRVARDGGDEADQALLPHYVEIIQRVLFASPLRRHPEIPDGWWHTPLGLSCRVCLHGIESVYDVIEQLDDPEGADGHDGTDGQDR